MKKTLKEKLEIVKERFIKYVLPTEIKRKYLISSSSNSNFTYHIIRI